MNNSCCSDAPNKGTLSVEEGLARILASVSARLPVQSLALEQAFNRVLAEDVHSPINVPAYANSAMDGYALRSQDLGNSAWTTLRVVGEALAGHAYTKCVGEGEAIRIMTGAVLPEGVDTVVKQEIVEREGERLRIPEGVEAGDNCRAAGEDIALGSQALAANTRIGAAELGLLASLGCSEVACIRPLRVAVLSTGDEICSPYEQARDGQIYDSNRFSLLGLLKPLGVDVIDLGIIADRKDELRCAFKEAAAQADMVLTSGGVSVGDADYVKQILEEIGEVNFWKMAMRPGRPLAYGSLDGAVFFGLPGNPVAVMVGFLQFVLPLIKQMQGELNWRPLRLRASAQHALRKRRGRSEFQRGFYTVGPEGCVQVESTGAQGSGVLSSMSRGNCLIVLEHERDDVAAGDWVTIQPFVC